MITHLQDVRPRPRRVAVGTFDGMHLGHREVARGSDTVLTFDPHPRSIIRPGHYPQLLTSLRRKAEIIGSLGVEEVVVIPFDREFSERSAPQFIDEVLVDRLGATHVSVGENFHFGHRAEGGPGLLQADDRFETRVVRLLEADGGIVSSSHIRGLLLGGAVAGARRLLGEPFVLGGEVAHGEKRGRTIGFPTANLVPDDDYVTPGHGVYACVASVEGDDSLQQVPTAVSIGVRPQFDSRLGELVEAYLLDTEADLYGRWMDLAFLKNLRGEKRFDSVEDLIAQMDRDVEATRSICTQLA